jgi:hypothetical protein
MEGRGRDLEGDPGEDEHQPEEEAQRHPVGGGDDDPVELGRAA